MSKRGNIWIRVPPPEGPKNTMDTSKADPALLSIFGHRFMSIAEQVGPSQGLCDQYYILIGFDARWAALSNGPVSV